MSQEVPSAPKSLVAFVWFTLLYNIAVIIWGGYVRATSSGAGCGSHWPDCNGEIIPTAPHIKTIIEFTHRLTSGLALIFVVVGLLWIFLKFPKKHIARTGAGLSLFFIVVEAGIGAGLVLLRLVGEDQSVGRAVYLCVHLINTFLLLGALGLTAWWVSGGKRFRTVGQGMMTKLFWVGMGALMLLGTTGAIAALGDTLFPAKSFMHGLSQDFSATSHFLLKLRVIHPFLAIAVGIYLVSLAGYALHKNKRKAVNICAMLLIAMVLIQLVVGMMNLALLAPTALQMVHLFFADAVWVMFVLLSAAVFGSESGDTLGKSVYEPVQPELSGLASAKT
ncbi:MAG: COX15/CtaA family protein [Blastocatellia bacterium]|nr:COX15/CtaA family protein [Blastocatellia bacterium]